MPMGHSDLSVIGFVDGRTLVADGSQASLDLFRFYSPAQSSDYIDCFADMIAT